MESLIDTKSGQTEKIVTSINSALYADFNGIASFPLRRLQYSSVGFRLTRFDICMIMSSSPCDCGWLWWQLNLVISNALDMSVPKSGSLCSITTPVQSVTAALLHTD